MSTRKPLPDWLGTLPSHLNRPFRYVTFGQAIARKRKERGLSQSKLAQAASISRNYISLLERNKRNNLSLAIFLRIACALDVDACEFLKIYELLEADWNA